MRSFLAGLIVAVVLGGCAGAPIQPPANDPAPVTLPAVRPSEIEVPVSLNLLKLKADMLRQLPKPLVQGESVLPLSGMANAQALIRYQMAVTDLDLHIVKQHFTVRITASFVVQSELHSALGRIPLASCGVHEPPPLVRMRVEGALIAGVNGVSVLPEDWHLHWLQPCRLTGLNVDLGGLLNLPVVRDKVNSAVHDALVQELGQNGMRTALAGIWPVLNQPLDLGHGLWLMVHPSAMAINGMEGHGLLLALNLQLKASPEVVGVRPLPVATPPLPDLKPWSAQPQFHVRLSMDLPLVQANALLNQYVAGRSLQENGHTVLIHQVELYGHQTKAVLGLGLDQPFAGQIYVEATPVFDLQKGELYFKDLDYAVSTSSMLTRTASWMLSNHLKKKLMQQLRIPFSQAVVQLERYTRAPLDLGHGLKAHLQVQHFQPEGLWLTAHSIQSVLDADGSLTLAYGIE